MKKLLVIACALFMVGCEDMDGTLNVFKTFTATTNNGSESIASGDYHTSLNFKRKEIIATLNAGDRTIQMTIKIPKGSSLPDNGAFNLTSTQIGQPFNIAGTNQSSEERSDMRYEYNSCQYTRYEQWCTPQGCYTRPVTVWGQQRTQYYFSTVNRHLQFDMKEDNLNGPLAHFAGSSESTQKVIVNQSPCW